MAEQSMEVDQQNQRSVINDEDVVTCVRFAPLSHTEDFSLMSISNIYGEMKLYRYQNPQELLSGDVKPIFQTKDHFFPINDIAFCPHSRTIQPYLATCSDDTLINMYDICKQALVRTFIGHSNFVSHVKFNNITNVLLSSGSDNSIILWDIRTNKSIFKILGHPEPITSIDITSDNTMITSSSYDGYVRLWDMLKGSCLKTMVADSGSTTGIGLCKLTPNSKYMLFANLNSKMGLYNYLGEMLKSYVGHKNQEFCIDATFVKSKEYPDSQLIVTGSEDGKICGWDLNTQQMIIKHEIDKSIVSEKQMLVSSLDFDSRSEMMAACGNFKGLYLQQMKTIINQ